MKPWPLTSIPKKVFKNTIGLVLKRKRSATSELEEGNVHEASKANQIAETNEEPIQDDLEWVRTIRKPRIVNHENSERGNETRKDDVQMEVAKTEMSKQQTRATEAITTNTIKEKTRTNQANRDTVVDIEELEMSEFLKDIENSRNQVYTIEKNLTVLEEAYESQILACTPDAETEAKQRVETLNNEIKEAAAHVQTHLKILDKLYKPKLNGNEDSVVEADVRLQQSHSRALTRKFATAMQEYRSIQIKYEKRYKDLIAKQCKVLNLSEKSTEQILDNVNVQSQVGNQLWKGQNLEQITKHRDDLLARQDSLLQLERSIAELNSLFVDMALLTKEQGFKVNHIDTNVKQATGYAVKTNTTLAEAARLKRQIRRNRCWSATGLIIIIGVIVTFLSL